MSLRQTKHSDWSFFTTRDEKALQVRVDREILRLVTCSLVYCEHEKCTHCLSPQTYHATVPNAWKGRPCSAQAHHPHSTCGFFACICATSIQRHERIIKSQTSCAYSTAPASHHSRCTTSRKSLTRLATTKHYPDFDAKIEHVVPRFMCPAVQCPKVITHSQHVRRARYKAAPTCRCYEKHCPLRTGQRG